MSKPFGMTPTFQVIHPTRAEDKVWEAVQEAIAAGMTPDRFITEVRAAWKYELAEAAKYADEQLKRPR